ncbi:pancreatic secretory granule membrane major glycoprotein GP2-like [Hyperolius riggenbachi]|uniref:pancreatic secretory granule membrane major glycoprotein GP2-like n=1 Tax=Hyperolius riggenbachi TaxID=752182 RepID=UPI0035A389AE
MCTDDTCNGDCYPQNGCFCADFTPCYKNSCDLDSNECCSAFPGYYWNSSRSCCTSDPVCYPSCGVDEDCVAVNNQSLCNCSITYYHNLTSKDLHPSINCDKLSGVIITSISKCELKMMGYNVSNVHVNDYSCNASYDDVINSTKVISFQIPAQIDACGNNVKNNSGKMYFTNTLHIYPLSGPLITKNPILYNFTCEFDPNMQTSLGFALHPVASTIIIPGPSGSGTFSVTMAAYHDSGFSNPIQQNEDVPIADLLYIGIFTTSVDGNTFVLYTDNCTASPSNTSSDTNAVPLLIGGVAVTDTGVDVHMSENENSTEVRFEFSTFKFADYSEVYVSCFVRLCSATERCNKARAASTDGGGTLSIPIQLNNFIDASSAGHHTAAGWIVLAGSLLAYLSAKVL